MSCEGSYRRWWSSILWVLLMLAIGFGAGPACNGNGGGGGPTRPSFFSLRFSLDASFQGLHGDQPVSIAVIRSVDGAVVARGNGTVSATQEPSYSFATGSVLQSGLDYEVHYWIDSNIGGGTEGVCDPRAIDHQWSVELRSVANDIDLTVSHAPELTEDVCATFA